MDKPITDPDSIVVIEYTVLKIENGFMGATRRPGGSWSWTHVRPMDQDVAVEAAQHAAEEEAEHYVGEWNVFLIPVKPGT